MHVVRRRPSLALLPLIGFMLAFGTTGQTAGQQGQGATAQKNDDEYTKRILDNTPDKRILTELVDHMPRLGHGAVAAEVPRLRARARTTG